MEKLNSNSNGLFFVTKSEITEEILKSKKELILLGTTAFGISWHYDKLDETLLKKYIENDYRITVIAESDPHLYSNALVSSLNSTGTNYPIAMLTETRDNSTIKLREYFISEFNKKNISKSIVSSLEPIEDTCRKKLDSIYEEKYALNIYKELITRGAESTDLLKRVVENLSDKYQELANSFFNKSNIFTYFIEQRDYFNLSKYNGQYCKHLNEIIGEKLNKIKSIEELIEFTREKIVIPFVLDLDDEKKKNININLENDLRCDFEISSHSLRMFCLKSLLNILLEKEKRDYKLIKEYASKEAYAERSEKSNEFSKTRDFIQRFKVKHIFHPIPIQMIRIDNTYYANINPINTFDTNQFLYVGNCSLNLTEDNKRFCLFDKYVEYFEAYENSKYCIEETEKGNRKEVIYNYMSNHAIIGQMPRDSFYGSENYKLVMWALVFDREGRILIHKRDINAKDNQGMWDKSVGGHIAITDRDTIDGASREIAEELYTVEEFEQGHSRGSNWFNANKDKIIYLGKWNEARYPNFATNLRLESDEFYSFSFESRLTSQPIDSMRVLPDGTHIKAKCFVDLYFVVTSEEFDLSELKNSKYLVLYPHQIKKFAKIGELPQTVSSKECGAFEVTPDLEYMINSPEWDNEITKFSIRVKEAFANKIKQ